MKNILIFLFTILPLLSYSQTHCATPDRPVDKNGFVIICGKKIHENEFISNRLIEYSFKNQPTQLTFSEAKSAIKKALSTWNKATGIGFKEVSLSSNPDIVFEWPVDKTIFTENELAHVPYWNCDGTYYGSKVNINENHSWSTNGSYLKYDLESVILHEVGHIIGLGHNKSNTSIMKPTFSPGESFRALTSFDLNTVETLFPGEYFSTRDNVRGFSWNKTTNNVSYIIWDYNTFSSKLYLRKYNGTNYYGEIKIQTFSTADNIRGWSYDEQSNLCSYIAYNDSKKKSYLFVVEFDGWNWGEEKEKIVLGSSDNFNGWSWNKNFGRSSYIANDGISNDYLYVVDFDGEKFGDVEKKILMAKRNNVRAWNWDISNNLANYLSYIRDGRNTLQFNTEFNGYKFENN